MSVADVSFDPAAWSAEDQRWYADLVMHCMGMEARDSAPDVLTVLAQLAALPLDQCLHMRGEAFLDGRHRDRAGWLWSHSGEGRWFSNHTGKKLWLGRKIAGLRHGCSPLPKELQASHLCGNCDCIRWHHVRGQSKQQDVLDRVHHQRHGNVLRPEVRAQGAQSSVSADSQETPHRPVSYRSPATSRDV